MQRRQPLRRQAPIRRESPAHARQRRTQGVAYAGAPDAGQSWCSACGVTGLRLDHSHLLAQGRHQQHRNDSRNWLLMCRDCHEIYEHNKREFARQFPDVWALILKRIEEVAPVSYLLFRHKNPW